MRQLSRYAVVLVASLTMVFAVQVSIYAQGQDCWGARPLSMGGAFVAVSDDVHGIYWNQAALSRVKSLELTYTPTIHDRDLVNYDDFFGAAFPLGAEGEYGTLGLAFVLNKDELYVMPGAVKTTWEDWYMQVGYGIEVADGLSLGLATKYLEKEQKIEVGGGTVFKADDDVIGIDLSLLWEINDMFSVGVLWQDVNKPEWKGLEYIRNFRPGIAFKPLRDDTLILALDMYDASGQTDDTAMDVGQDLRFGVEWWPVEHVALRAGAYHFNSEVDAMEAVTAGVGYVHGNLELDYAIMYWTDSDDATHMIGITYKF